MKKALETLLQAKADCEDVLENTKDEATAQQMTIEISDLNLAIAIIDPIEKATSAELTRWRDGYAGIRNHCIEKGYDLT